MKIITPYLLLFVLSMFVITSCSSEIKTKTEEFTKNKITSTDTSNTSHRQLLIDHMNIAVSDLSKTKLLFIKLGFTIKPGRLHKNSINNLHMKFNNNTEIELISATNSYDNLAGEYLDLIIKGDGGAFLALRTNFLKLVDSNEFKENYRFRVYKNHNIKNLVFNENQILRSLWFTYSLNLEEDIKYTSHQNTAVRLSAVWISNNIETEVLDLMHWFKVQVSESDYPMKCTKKISLENGDIYLVNLSVNKNGRPIVGATVEIEDISQAVNILQSYNIPYTEFTNKEFVSLIISPEYTGSIYLELREHLE